MKLQLWACKKCLHTYYTNLSTVNVSWYKKLFKRCIPQTCPMCGSDNTVRIKIVEK